MLVNLIIYIIHEHWCFSLYFDSRRKETTVFLTFCGLTFDRTLIWLIKYSISNRKSLIEIYLIHFSCFLTKIRIGIWINYIVSYFKTAIQSLSILLGHTLISDDQRQLIIQITFILSWPCFPTSNDIHLFCVMYIRSATSISSLFCSKYNK